MPFSPLHLIGAVLVGSGWLTTSLGWPREAWPNFPLQNEALSHPNPPAASGHVGTALGFESVYARSVRGFSPTVTVAVTGERRSNRQILVSPAS